MIKSLCMAALAAGILSWAMPGQSLASQSDTGWTIVDDGTCRVWDFEPESRDSRVITWSGACPDGIASGSGELRVIWEGGLSTEVYVGQMRAGRQNGLGVLTMDEGRFTYLGHWKDGLFHGAGVHKVEERIMTGQFVDGEVEGPATITFTPDSPRHGDMINITVERGWPPVGKSIYRFKDGRVFVGSLENSDLTPDEGRYISDIEQR